MEQPVLIKDKPHSTGLANVLRRAEQLARLRWTPICDMPKSVDIRPECDDRPPLASFKAWRPQQGLPYSSVRRHEKFIGYNVSIETFMTALANPQSVLYTRDLTKNGVRMAGWYGTVCSSFVCYALDLPYRRTCGRWGLYDDMVPTQVDSANKIMLGDILCSKKHVGLVTGVLRHRDGSVFSVSVTESTRPQIITTEYTPEEFENYWLKPYRVFRYTGIEQVSYTPSPYVPLPGDPPLDKPPINSTLLPDYGDKANYSSGEPVVLNVMQPGWDRLIVQNRDGKVLDRPLKQATGLVDLPPLKSGFYHAFCIREGEQSQSVEFAFVHLNAECVGKPEPNKPLELTFTLPPQDRLVCCIVARVSDGFTVTTTAFSDAQSQARTISLPRLEPGDYQVKTLARNAYGLYCSAPFELKIGE
jgi:hypothetical protein